MRLHFPIRLGIIAGTIVAAAAFAAVLAAPAFAETRVALVIGNGAYKNAPRLPNPANDANDVATALRRSGFDTILATDLDRNGMEDATFRFARAARTADVALFYYSGHALQFGGVNYLMPVDARLTDETDLRRLTRVDEIVSDLQQAKSLRILVLDACRSNPLADQLQRSVVATRGGSAERGIARIENPQGMIVAYATQAGHTAEDGTGRNSPYTAAFLKHIEERDEIGMIFRSVSEDVYEQTRHTQLPELSLSIIGRFYLNGKIEISVKPSTPVNPGSSANPGSSVSPRPSVNPGLPSNPGPSASINPTRPAFASQTALSTPGCCHDISGAGATFPFPIYSKWAGAYKEETGNGLNYQSIGSGGGIKQIQAKTVTFGASDMPLKPEQLDKDGLIQWPMVMDAIVPIVNIEGVRPGELVFDGATLADIYMGRITKWDDPAIRRLNPNVRLPSDAISVVRRADTSGTTFYFTNYLAKVSADWKSKIGEGSAIEWPVGIGAKANEGVASNVTQTRGAIGYVEYAYARQNRLTYAGMVNKAGRTVQPTVEALQAAASSADWASSPGYYMMLTDQPGEKSWPITASTFILMHKEPSDKAAAADALRFFKWSFEHARMATELDYIPMPDDVVRLIEQTWSSKIRT
jgi:phosphate transport system substrate-binding protein